MYNIVNPIDLSDYLKLCKFSTSVHKVDCTQISMVTHLDSCDDVRRT